MTKSRALVLIGAILLIAVPVVLLQHFTKELQSNLESKLTTNPLSSPTSSPVLSELSHPKVTSAEQSIIDQITLRHGAGDYEAALKIANKALDDSGTSEALKEWIKRQLPTLLSSRGWMLAQAQRCYDAIEFFRQANALFVLDASEKGLAYCYAELRNAGLATEYFLNYLKRNPSDKAMQLRFLDVLESDLQFGRAAELADELVKIFPDDTELKNSAKTMHAKANEAPRQTSIESPHFRLVFRAEDHAPIADTVFAILEQALSDLTDRYGFDAPSALVEVILYPSSYYKNVIPGAPDWANGMFDGRIRLPIDTSMAQGKNDQMLQRLLRHELSHALLALMCNFRNIPTWFNEGLAQIVECGMNSGCLGQAFPPGSGEFLTSDELSGTFTSFDRSKASRAYRQSIYLIATAKDKAGNDTEEAITRILSGLKDPGTIDGDRILAPLGFKFSNLYNASRKGWNKIPRW